VPYQLHEVSENLGIYIAIDGVSLTKSSRSQFWPIVGFIPSLKDSSPFEIGVYWGLSKPETSTTFLQRVIDEAESLFENGMVWMGRKTTVRIDAFICDAPARAWLTCTKSHSSFLHGCSKCKGAGVIIGALRDNRGFRNRSDRLHHHGFPSIIEILR